MFVLSDRLTTGQLTFVFRLVVQLLSYGGLCLIGLIILGHTPRVAPLETHDTLNRVVGKSTATSTTIRWIKKRVFSKSQDPTPSLHLLIALILSLSYGLFVALSDVGFIGLQACSVPFPPYTDYPASVHSEADARALVQKHVIEGANPANIKSFRCNSAEVVSINTNQTLTSCTSWSNSTYNDPSTFRLLNLTDTDVLMYQNLGPDRGQNDLQVYYFGSLGSIKTQAKVESGIAVIPHKSGARMVIGAPDLRTNQTVTIPKTMVVEVSVGCLPLGLVGMEDPGTLAKKPRSDYFIPDAQYKPSIRSKYTGPDYLFEPLLATADEIRQLVLPQYNTSAVLSNGYIERAEATAGWYSWTTEIDNWIPSMSNFSDSRHSDILQGCGERVHRALNITVPPRNETQSDACSNLALSGSFIEEGGIILRGYSAMACASTTSVKMSSAVLTTDQNGLLTAEILDLPSELHGIKADFWDIQYNKTTDTTFYNSFGSAQRFTLSDNPEGQKAHYILQTRYLSSNNAILRGAASAGFTIPQIGFKSIGANSLDVTAAETMINGTFFSCANFTSSLVTTWAGGHAASFFLSSYAMNGFAGLDKEPLRVRSTGGKEAVCYQAPYFAAFVPLLLAALFIIIWSAFMLVTSKFRGTKVWEARYGGLAPTIMTPGPTSTKKSPDEILAWEDFGESPHLRPFNLTMPTTTIIPLMSYDSIASRMDKEY